MREFAVVTTFNKIGLEKYGQKMIDSYLENWPREVTLHVYAEDCNPVVPNDPRIKVYDLHSTVPELVSFKERWKNEPKANGDVSQLRQRARKDSHKSFKWDAIRFSHKVYSIFHCAKNCDADVLFWMDADMVCHSPITMQEIDSLVPIETDLCYIGRERKWAECGLYSINLKTVGGLEFLERFQWVYDNAEEGIFKMEEWHDSFVFEEVKKGIPLRQLNWAEGLIKGEGHPLINSIWGKYLDHLKGGRKNQGKSLRKDLLKPRNEQYWRNV